LASTTRGIGCTGMDELRRRIARLRALEAQLALLPRTHEREALLLDVRGRIVALDTGNESGVDWTRGSAYPNADPVARDLLTSWP
jgi:hypothetical protein